MKIFVDWKQTFLLWQYRHPKNHIMFRGLPSPVAHTLFLPLCFRHRNRYRPKCTNREMGLENSISQGKTHVSFRLCKVSSHTTELLEIRSKNPTLYVLLIPGNPGVVTFYKDFLESLYDLFGGSASVTAIGHISHTKKNWEHGRLFSLQEQIEHKIDFIKYELQSIKIPIILVGHSIGSYISIETFRRSTEKVIYCIALYPFLALNPESSEQSYIRKITASPILCAIFGSVVAFLGLLPRWASRFIVIKSLGKSWSDTAVEAACTHLLKYHTVRNIFFLAMTEFKKLTETPDWAFMREKQGQIAFLFGMDDHWGPLSMYEEISRQVPDVALSIEREGHLHSFCCSEAGSLWVAQHVASLIKSQTSSSSQSGISFKQTSTLNGNNQFVDMHAQ
ncbi:hypothetical protein L1049_008100 [Liquidambar formosana]|uniref:Lipid droplet-associated hydrolase n=1 Tax=Liquidambar formosana TaxID=63359 RepID=A0AAP0S321_LIQFO